MSRMFVPGPVDVADQDARAGDAAGDVGGAVEPLEDTRQLGGGDAHAFVLDLEHRPLAVGAAFTLDADADGALGGAVLHRVGEQVVQHPPDTDGVPLPYQRLVVVELRDGGPVMDRLRRR